MNKKYTLLITIIILLSIFLSLSILNREAERKIYNATEENNTKDSNANKINYTCPAKDSNANKINYTCPALEKYNFEPNATIEVYYSFGPYEKNILDGEKGSYIVDWCEGTREFKIMLNESDKTKIYETAYKNNFFGINENFTCNLEECGAHVSTQESETLKITVNGKTKIILWEIDYDFSIETLSQMDENLEKDRNSQKMILEAKCQEKNLEVYRNVTKVIMGILSQKENEMNIRKPICGYI